MSKYLENKKLNVLDIGYTLEFGCCFGDFCSFSYFFSAFLRLLSWVLEAVLGVFSVSATFFWLFSGFWTGFGVLFGGFQRFQLLFPALFRIFGGILGAVLRIFAVSAPQGPLAMLSTYGYCTLCNVYPMSRTFSFLFSKYLDTKFYGIPGFIQWVL